MHIILTGATGTCGSAVLQHCLSSPAITRLTVLSRRPVPKAEGHSKASVILLEDFSKYPQSLLDQVRGAEACVWALGVRQHAVDRKKYIEITHNYPLAAAEAFSTLSEPFKFVYVSGEGADPTERTFTLFGKIKGRAEKDLHALSASESIRSLRTFALRPAFIDPEGEILRDPPPRALKRTTNYAIASILQLCWTSFIIGAKPLARVLTEVALGDGKALPAGEGVEAEGRTVRNVAIQRLAAM